MLVEQVFDNFFRSLEALEVASDFLLALFHGAKVVTLVLRLLNVLEPFVFASK